MEDRLADVLFSDPFPKICLDQESQKSVFRFDLNNSLGVGILWIVRFWTFVKKKSKICFWIQESGFRFSQKMHPK